MKDRRTLHNLFAYDRTLGTGIGRMANTVLALNTFSPGLRRYQVLIQESVLPFCLDPDSIWRWRAIIQSYALTVHPLRRQPQIWSSHLIKSPNGIVREIPVLVYRELVNFRG